MSPIADLVLLFIVLAFGLGMYFSHRLDKPLLDRKSAEIRRLTAELDACRNLLEGDGAMELVRELGGRAAQADQLVEDLAFGIDHACELHMDRKLDEAWYVIYGLDDRMKVAGRGPKPKKVA